MMDSTLLNRLAQYVDEHPARTNGSVVCPECGKAFKPTSDWGYGIGEKNYCSWHCVRAAEKRPPKIGRYNCRTSPFDGHEKEMAARLASGETISAVAGEYARSCSELGDVESGRQYTPRKEKYDDGTIKGQMRMSL